MLSDKRLDDYSVIMSVYDKVRPEFLDMSLNSVFGQTKMTTQFILIKDGKLTEEQEAILNKYINEYENIIDIYEFEENVGAGNAYNKGIEMCKNSWAAIMDSDDIILKEKFEKQLIFLNEHKDIDAIGTNAVEFLDDIENVVSTRIMPENHNDIYRFAHMRCPMIQPTVLFSVKKVIESGNYQESELTEDYDLYIRMLMNGCNFYNYQEVLYYVRTNKDFFKRRGGIQYLKSILKFKYKYYKKGFYNTYQFFKTACASIVVTLMPNSWRMLFYKKFLRK